MRTTCSKCGSVFDVADRFAGKTARCRSCGSLFQIGDASDGLRLQDDAGMAPSLTQSNSQPASPTGADAPDDTGLALPNLEAITASPPPASVQPMQLSGEAPIYQSKPPRPLTYLNGNSQVAPMILVLHGLGIVGTAVYAATQGGPAGAVAKIMTVYAIIIVALGTFFWLGALVAGRVARFRLDSGSFMNFWAVAALPSTLVIIASLLSPDDRFWPALASVAGIVLAGVLLFVLNGLDIVKGLIAIACGVVIAVPGVAITALVMVSVLVASGMHEEGGFLGIPRLPQAAASPVPGTAPDLAAAPQKLDRTTDAPRARNEPALANAQQPPQPDANPVAPDTTAQPAAPAASPGATAQPATPAASPMAQRAIPIAPPGPPRQIASPMPPRFGPTAPPTAAAAAAAARAGARRAMIARGNVPMPSPYPGAAPGTVAPAGIGAPPGMGVPPGVAVGTPPEPAGPTAPAPLSDFAQLEDWQGAPEGAQLVLPSSRGSVFAVVSTDRLSNDVVDIWSIAPFEKKTTLKLGGSGNVSYAISPNGESLLRVLKGVSPVAEVWSIASGSRAQQTTLSGNFGEATALGFPDANTFAILWKRNRSFGLEIFDIQKNVTKRRVSWDAGFGMFDYDCTPYNVAFNPDGKTMCLVDGQIKLELVDCATGSMKKQWPMNVPDAHSCGVSSMAFSPDGKRVAVVVDESVFDGRSCIVFGDLTAKQMSDVAFAKTLWKEAGLEKRGGREHLGRAAEWIDANRLLVYGELIVDVTKGSLVDTVHVRSDDTARGPGAASVFAIGADKFLLQPATDAWGKRGPIQLLQLDLTKLQ